MAPGYGVRRAGSSPWPILRPGPRSSLSRELTWRPLGPEDNHELAALIARAEDVDNPPYRTSEQEPARSAPTRWRARSACQCRRARPMPRLRTAGSTVPVMEA